MAEQCLRANNSGSCALMLLFLSDGRPSDHVPKGKGPKQPLERLSDLMGERAGGLAKSFGRRLTLGTIGFSAEGAEFGVLKQMAVSVGEYGSHGIFQRPELAGAALRVAVTTLTTTLTACKTEMTLLPSGAAAGGGGGGVGGPSRQRTVREVQREPLRLRTPGGGLATSRPARVDPNDWFIYRGEEVVHRKLWSVPKRRWEYVDRFVTPGAAGVAMRKAVFGEGAERNVRAFSEVGADELTLVGPELVAKESRFLEDASRKTSAGETRSFHTVFAQTQARAQLMAQEFNRRLSLIPGAVAASAPRVRFLECAVYEVQDANEGTKDYLVERMIDNEAFQKCAAARWAAAGN